MTNYKTAVNLYITDTIGIQHANEIDRFKALIENGKEKEIKQALKSHSINNKEILKQHIDYINNLRAVKTVTAEATEKLAIIPK